MNQNSKFQIKKILKLCLPPICTLLIRKIKVILSASKPKNNSQNANQLEFSTFDLANKYCATEYENSILLDSISNVTSKFVQSLDNDPFYLIDNNIKHVFFGLGFIHSNNINVLDFGGGLGAHFSVINKFMPQKIKSWHIIETPQMTQYANLFKDSKLRFYTNIDEISKNKYDFIYVNSALQYTANPIQIIKKLLALEAPYIYLARHPLSDKPTYFTIQTSKIAHNGPRSISVVSTNDNKAEIKTVCAIMNIEEFEQTMQKHYKILIKSLEHHSFIDNTSTIAYVLTRK